MEHIRDPIHGRVSLSPAERVLVDHPVFQRLRGIKQLGFTHLAFPGATHTRYAHGLGAMHVAAAMFDALFPAEFSPLTPLERSRLRQMVRLALLFHDLGHAPFSHASETCMPLRSALGLDARFTPEELTEKATHEDFTLKLLLDSSLRRPFEAGFGHLGITPEDLGQLITGRCPERAHAFRLQGVDWGPLLSQLVSGEMDADRMDYLQRDAFFTGVSYGRFDQTWLLENLTWHIDGADEAHLALSHRAVFAFEDFLLSRLHMFVSVYYHHVPVGFDAMLARYHQTADPAFRLPADPEEYAQVDDVTLQAHLRQSDNRWARRIAQRQAFTRILELNAEEGAPDVEALTEVLSEAGVDHFVSRDEGVLSKYYGPASAEAFERPIYIVNHSLGQAVPIHTYSRLYERYAQPATLTRVYCLPDHAERARQAITALLPR